MYVFGVILAYCAFCIITGFVITVLALAISIFIYRIVVKKLQKELSR